LNFSDRFKEFLNRFILTISTVSLDKTQTRPSIFRINLLYHDKKKLFVLRFSRQLYFRK